MREAEGPSGRRKSSRYCRRKRDEKERQNCSQGRFIERAWEDMRAKLRGRSGSVELLTRYI